MKRLVQTSAKLVYVSVFGICLLLLTANQTVGAAGNGLLAHWKFDKTSQGATAQDSSGNGNNAKPISTGGGPEPSTNTPNVSHNNPRAAHFTEENQYCTTGPRESFSFNEEITVAAWINPADDESRQIMRAKPELEDIGIEFGTAKTEPLIDPDCKEEEIVYDKSTKPYSTAMLISVNSGKTYSQRRPSRAVHGRMLPVALTGQCSRYISMAQ